MNHPPTTGWNTYILIWELAEYRIYCHRKPQFYATPTLPGGLRSDSFHPHPSHVAAYVDGVLACQFVYLFKPTKRCAKDETRWGLYTRLTWGRKVSEKFLKINLILSTSVLVRGGWKYCRAWHGSRLLAQPEWYKSLIRNKQNSWGRRRSICRVRQADNTEIIRWQPTTDNPDERG